MTAAGLAQQLRDGAGSDEVQADLKDARLLGESGVPFFVLDECVAMPGAREPETFLKLLAEGNKKNAAGSAAGSAAGVR